MERIIKIILILCLTIGTITPVFAQTSLVKKVELAQCIKTFPTGYEKLYYLTLAAMNENNFNISEIQTKGGYITFSVNNQKFLASIVYVSSTKAMLKITPCDGKYYFSPEIPEKIFRYIEAYQTKNF